MPIRIHHAPPTLTLTLSGDIDHHSARSLMLSLDREVAQRLPRRLILDLSEVSFMDSSGIALLLRCRRQCGELGCELVVSQVPDQAKKVLVAAGLDKLLPLS